MRDLPQISCQPPAVKLSFQYFRKSGLRSRTTRSAAGPIARVVDGEGGFIQIPLELKPGFMNEALVFPIMADGGQFLARIHFSDLAQVDVEKGIRSGQQTGWLRWSMLS